jgi:hypothetical protein
MIVSNSQQDVVIDLPKNVKHVGLKISGGADSAIVGYMLSKYVVEERPDITIIPITVNQVGKAYQEQFAKQVLGFLKKEFGNIYGKHYTSTSQEFATYASTQDDLMKTLYDGNVIDCHFVGITQNPPVDITPKEGVKGPKDDREPGTVRPVLAGNSYRLLVNIDKKGVKELYDTFNLMDTLFPLTRSCEDVTDDFSKHCEQCWWCAERYYGFERYI